jgi:type III pantothenate kinase
VQSPQKVLALDVGNSFTKIGCFVDGILEATEHFPTDREELAQFEQDLTQGFPDMAENGLTGIVVSTVVPEIKPLLESILSNVIGPEKVLWVESPALSRLNCDNVNFSGYTAGALGADRIANVVGGHACFPEQKVAICDFGTTTTFDLVEPDGTFLGGAICPGPMMFQSLVNARHAAQLFEVDVFRQPEETPGITTESSLANGLYYGYKGAILEIVGNLLQQGQWPLSQVTFIFTGGYARACRDMVSQEILNVHIDAGLTLKGLYRLWELNCKTSLVS